jgi:ABC-type sugar transport system substrate-binding protein
LSKRVFVLLIGDKQAGELNHFQLLQEQAALEESRRLDLQVEVALAPGFDQARVLVRRLMDRAAGDVDAVVTEPANTATLDLMLNELRGKTGLVVVSAWADSLEQAARTWGAGLPFGMVGTDHLRVGEIQAAQANGLLRGGGRLLYVSGPLRSSAAQERMEGLKRHLRAGIEVEETAAGQWIESDGRAALENWYRIAKSRNPAVDVIAAGDDELAMGARRACEALPNPQHRDTLLKAKFLGVDACPTYGQKLVAQGLLTASVLTPANTGLALSHLHRFWSQGTPVPLRSFTQAEPWPPGSAVQ